MTPTVAVGVGSPGSTSDLQELTPGELAAPSGAVGDSMSVAMWTVVSRVTGVLRGIAIAAVLGATFFANTYQFTNSLPNLIFYGFLAGSLFSSLLVPAVVGYVDAGDRAGVARVAGGLLGVAMLGMIVLVPVVAVLTPALLTAGTFGLSRTGAVADQARLGTVLALLLLPQVPLYAVVGTATAVMNAHRRFALAAAAPALENLGTIAMLAVVLRLYPGATNDPHVPTGLLLLLGLGTTAAVALHASVQWWGARRVGVVLRPRTGWRDPEVRVVLRRAAPSLAQAALSAGLLGVMLLLATRTPGGVVALQLALNFFFLPIAVGATPVALSLVPRLARMSDSASAATFRDTYVRGLVFAAFLVVPAAVAYAALSGPMSRAVSYGGFAGPQGTGLLAACVAALSAGVLGETCFMVTTYACYARHDTRSPLRAMVVQVVVGLLVVAWAPLLSGPAMLALLGFGQSLGSLAGAGYLVRRLLRGLPPGQEPVLRPLLRIAFASAVMALPAWLVARLLTGMIGGTAGGRTGGPVMLAAAVVGAVVYFGVQGLLHAPEVVWVGDAARSRLGRAPRSGPGRRTDGARGVARIAPHRREAVKRLAIDVALLALAGVIGLLLAYKVMIGLGLVAVLALAGWIFWRPQVGAYLLIALTPLIAGIDRGSVIPVLRPNEAVLVLVCAAVYLRRLVDVRTGSSWGPRLNAIDLSLIGLGVAGSFLPLAMMVLRERQITGDDILYGIALWKLILVYLLVRVAVRTELQVRWCVWASMLSGGLVSLIGVLQALGLGGVQNVLATYYAPFGVTSALSIGRGSSTLSLPAAVADLAILNLALAIGMLRKGSGHRLVLGGLCVIYALGVLAAAEFSTVIGLVLAFVVIVAVTGSRRLITAAIPTTLIGGVLLWPVVQTRLAGFQSASGLPVSWTGRLRNLTTYFWPVLQSDHNWILGVRLSARVTSQAQQFGYIWIESGYTWLLWGGGLPFLASYLVVVWVTVRRGWRAGRRTPGVAGAVGVALVAGMVTDALLMLFDPHLTYRGAGDALFVVMALARVLGDRRSSPLGERSSPSEELDGQPAEPALESRSRQRWAH